MSGKYSRTQPTCAFLSPDTLFHGLSTFAKVIIHQRNGSIKGIDAIMDRLVSIQGVSHFKAKFLVIVAVLCGLFSDAGLAIGIVLSKNTKTFSRIMAMSHCRTDKEVYKLLKTCAHAIGHPYQLDTSENVGCEANKNIVVVRGNHPGFEAVDFLFVGQRLYYIVVSKDGKQTEAWVYDPIANTSGLVPLVSMDINDDLSYRQSPESYYKWYLHATHSVDSNKYTNLFFQKKTIPLPVFSYFRFKNDEERLAMIKIYRNNPEATPSVRRDISALIHLWLGVDIKDAPPERKQVFRPRSIDHGTFVPVSTTATLVCDWQSTIF